MKFQFESDMKKGQCYKCPCMMEDYENNACVCGVTDELTHLQVEQSECPLEEVKTVWHPYPAEKPAEGKTGWYWVTTETGLNHHRKFHENIVFWNGYVWGLMGLKIVAWAEKLEPYEEDLK